jgi:hypothetical protein
VKTRSKAAFFVAGFAVAVFVSTNLFTAIAQTSQLPPSAKPAASPAVSPRTTASANTAAQESPTPAVTGTIKGRLVSDDGQPLTNATVMIQSLNNVPIGKPNRVDAEGRFAFEELPPSAYLVTAIAPGYVDQSIAGNPSQWPRHLIGSNVRLTMTRGGVITGTVTNLKGEPVVSVPVNATVTGSKASSLSSFFSQTSNAQTDDRGVYRIYGLLPGQYLVNAGGGNGPFGGFSANGFDVDVPTYYPSATRDTAVAVSVRGGDETTGIDIKYRGAEGHSISGALLGEMKEGAMTGAITVLLSHAGTGSVLALEIAAVADPQRAYSFHGVADGDYDLFAGYFSGPLEGGSVANKRVTVRGGDLTGVDLRLAPLASLAGKIVLDPLKAEEKCDKRASQLMEIILNVPRDDPKKQDDRSLLAMMGGGLGTINDKGEFAFRNLDAARYRLDIKLPTESWYVRAINLPGPSPQRPSPSAVASTTRSNAAPFVIALKSGENVAGASVMIGQNAAGLRGILGGKLGGKLGQPDERVAVQAGTRIHLVPAEKEEADNLLRYRETFVESDGAFAFSNLAPGRYLILARVETPVEADTPMRPSAWDAAARAKLRREAEAANAIVDLKPCQNVTDYAVKLGG